MDETEQTHDWPLRPWLLAGLLGLAGLLIYTIGGGEGPDTRIGWRAAVSAFFFFGPLVYAFTLERDRWPAPLVFAIAVGTVMAGLAWRAVGSGDAIANPQYGFLAGLVATALALPLFQAGFHHNRWATPYRAIHGHVWNDAIGAAGSLAFVAASWLMLILLAELFRLLKIDVLRDLLQEGAFGWTWSGAAFGAALGVLRNEAAIIDTLRRVVMTVLSLLAVPLAAGLALFLAAMVVSGPGVLWAATRSATPVLLTCAAGAWVLANAILRDGDDTMSASRVLRTAALVLVLSILPLTVFAAVSMGTRVAQHGLSPERLWGLVAIAAAVAYGLAWLVAVVRGRRHGAWRERVRRANLHLAVMICGAALILAFPVLDFGAISARQQIARLESGKVSAQDFDFAALRWDFGAAGRNALRALERGSDPAVAKLAGDARRQTVRSPNVGPARTFSLRVQSGDPRLEQQIRVYLRSHAFVCPDRCVAIDLGAGRAGEHSVAIVADGGYTLVDLPFDRSAPRVEAARPAPPTLRPDSKVEVRVVSRRYITVDGRPIEPALDDRLLEADPPPR